MTLEEKIGQRILEYSHLSDGGSINMATQDILSIIQQEIDDAKPKWISVKDRLPEIGRAVIAFEPHCLTNRDKGMAVCIVDNEFCEKRSDGTYWITHWMPLPESPKEKL